MAENWADIVAGNLGAPVSNPMPVTPGQPLGQPMGVPSDFGPMGFYDGGPLVQGPGGSPSDFGVPGSYGVSPLSYSFGTENFFGGINRWADTKPIQSIPDSSLVRGAGVGVPRLESQGPLFDLASEAAKNWGVTPQQPPPKVPGFNWGGTIGFFLGGPIGSQVGNSVVEGFKGLDSKAWSLPPRVGQLKDSQLLEPLPPPPIKYNTQTWGPQPFGDLGELPSRLGGWNPDVTPVVTQSIRDQGYRLNSEGQWGLPRTEREFYDRQWFVDHGYYYKGSNGNWFINRDKVNTDEGRSLYNAGLLMAEGQLGPTFVLPNPLNAQGVDKGALKDYYNYLGSGKAQAMLKSEAAAAGKSVGDYLYGLEARDAGAAWAIRAANSGAGADYLFRLNPLAVFQMDYSASQAVKGGNPEGLRSELDSAAGSFLTTGQPNALVKGWSQNNPYYTMFYNPTGEKGYAGVPFEATEKVLGGFNGPVYRTEPEMKALGPKVGGSPVVAPAVSPMVVPSGPQNLNPNWGKGCAGGTCGLTFKGSEQAGQISRWLSIPGGFTAPRISRPKIGMSRQTPGDVTTTAGVRKGIFSS